MKVTVVYTLQGEKKSNQYNLPTEAKYFREMINILKDKKFDFKFYYH